MDRATGSCLDDPSDRRRDARGLGPARGAGGAAVVRSDTAARPYVLGRGRAGAVGTGARHSAGLRRGSSDLDPRVACCLFASSFRLPRLGLWLINRGVDF